MINRKQWCSRGWLTNATQWCMSAMKQKHHTVTTRARRECALLLAIAQTCQSERANTSLFRGAMTVCSWGIAITGFKWVFLSSLKLFPQEKNYMICLLCKDAGDVIIYLNWAHLILSWLHIKIKIPLDGVLPNFTLQYHDVMVMQFHMCLWHIQGVMAVLQRYIPVALSYFSLLLRTIVLLSLMQSLHCRYHDKLWAWSCAWNLPKILQIVNFESPCQNDPWISTTNCAFPFLIVLPWNTATLSWLLTMTWSWQCCHATREEKEESSYSLSREDSGLSLPGAFKLDHLQYVSPILYQTLCSS